MTSADHIRFSLAVETVAGWRVYPPLHTFLLISGYRPTDLLPAPPPAIPPTQLIIPTLERTR